MTFLDTNVFMLAIGREHPLRNEALEILEQGSSGATEFSTSAEVLQELLHAYLRRGRLDSCRDALELVRRSVLVVWQLEEADVRLAVALADVHPALEARDLVHLACCQRRGVDGLATFDRGLDAAWSAAGGRRTVQRR